MGLSKGDGENTEQQLIDAILNPAPVYDGFNRDQHPLPYIMSKCRDLAPLTPADKDFICELTKVALLGTDDNSRLK